MLRLESSGILRAYWCINVKKKESLVSFETLEFLYQVTRRHISENLNINIHRSQNFKHHATG
jgi:hypothetical protein